MAEENDPNVVVNTRGASRADVDAAANPLTITEVNVEESVVPEPVVKPNPDLGATITHRYPVEKEDRYGASVIFKVRKIIPPGPTGVDKSFIEKLNADPEISKLSQKARDISSDPNYKPEDNDNKSKEQAITDLAIEQEAIRQKNTNSSSIGYTDRYTDYVGINIKLYLPVSYQQSDSFNIATPELGQIGASALGALSGGKGIMGATKAAIDRGANTIVDFVTGGLAGDAARLAGAQLAGKIPIVGDELGQAAQIAGAVTVNPNRRSAFRGVGLREFAFSFKFIARSQREAQMVESIIRSFREYSYPESIELGGISAGFKYPSMFEIIVKHEPTGRRVGSKIKDCFLRSISTNYNPSSMAFHGDGRPVEIDLTLNFSEERTLSRKDIKDDY